MATNVGVLHLDVLVGDAMSLKDKRRVIKGFKDRVRVRHNVSVAEVGHANSRRRAVLAVAMVANEGRYIQGALQQIANAAEARRDMQVVASDIELW